MQAMRQLKDIFAQFPTPRDLQAALQGTTTVATLRVAKLQDTFHGNLIGKALASVLEKHQGQNTISVSDIGTALHRGLDTTGKSPLVTLNQDDKIGTYGFSIRPSQGDHLPVRDIPPAVEQAINNVKQLIAKTDGSLLSPKGNLRGELYLIPEIAEGTYIVLRDGIKFLNAPDLSCSGKLMLRQYSFVDKTGKKDFPPLVLIRDYRDDKDLGVRTVYMPEMDHVPNSWLQFDPTIRPEERFALPVTGRPTIFAHLPEGLADQKFSSTRRNRKE
jgi:hypothetical protein